MKVKELIAELQNYDPDWDVYVFDSYLQVDFPLDGDSPLLVDDESKKVTIWS